MHVRACVRSRASHQIPRACISSASFVHPVSRRELTKQDCIALDAHLAACSLRKVGVTEVFEHKERLNDPEERIAMLRQEASAIIEAFFSGSSMRQRGGGGGSGRGGAVARVPRNPPPPRQGRGGEGRGAGRRADVGGVIDPELWGFVIDDDEELARATERGLAAMAAAAEVEAFPELGGSGYQGPGAGWRPKLAKDELRPPSASGAAAFNTKGLGTVLHVSWAHVAKPKKVQTKHLAQLLYPYACAVKWLDSNSALVLVRPESDAEVSQEAALSAVDKNNSKGFAVVTLDQIACMLEEKTTHKSMVDYKGRAVRRMSLPSVGEFRFLVAQLHHASLARLDGDSSQARGGDSGLSALPCGACCSMRACSLPALPLACPGLPLGPRQRL